MENQNQDPFGMMAMVNAWMKPFSSLWDGMTGDGGSSPEPSTDTASGPQGKGPNRSQAAMAASLKNWQAMAKAMASPESVKALLKGSTEMPDVMLKLAQTGVSSLATLQENLIKSAGRLGKSVEAYRFEDIDENICRLWTDIYEKEFRRFFQIPQLGLLREYQEKANHLVDQYNLLQSQIAEFVRMLGLPFNHSMQVMQERLGEMAEQGKLSDDSHEYYKMWIKVLEGHFMTLFQTPEYVDTLNRTISAMADFAAARDAVFEDVFSLLPVAKKSEVDDMARDLFELKKRLKKLEKEKAHLAARKAAEVGA
ncbi:putative PhaE: poly(3-hydroxyalkanoate) synthase component [Desulfosarcina cetonica]|uniref:poly(R)-hydroxyalkanoic acid synthase subunit PhaE n=1 Tax=Desulfosarcina cetonica TaxID=90730 RepID=UPI0006D1CAC9|nr:poly(R)-hydroxyalkanoic acid synthase subunit PhaE [Desulfosarcina cetonica]VTR70943.1 putative PhaE: poly(3-hydroxyalkanoate) synthase component [Desulfosarcina cetonica]